MDNDGETERMSGETAVVPNFNPGTVLRLTFSMLWKNPLLYLGLACVANIPRIVIDYFSATRTGERIGALMSLVIPIVFMGAIAYGVYMGLIGERAGVWEAVRRGLSRYVSLLGFSLIASLFASCIVVVGAVLGLFGELAAFAVLIYCFCVYVVTMPACVVERLGVTQSMRRSAILTRGHRWAIFGLYLLMALLAVMVSAVIDFIFLRLFLIGFSFSDPAPDLFRGTGFTVAMILFGILCTAFVKVNMSVLYFQLRASREGVAVRELARVFE